MGVYTDPKAIQELIQSRTSFAGSMPTGAFVERIIEGVEDAIDNNYNYAWRDRKVTDEYYTSRWDQSFRLLVDTPYVDLKKFWVKPLSSAKGDKLEIWNGSAYVDWLVGGKQHGRNADYFLQEKPGRLYFMRGYPWLVTYRDGVRMTFRYGDPDIPGHVHMLATQMAMVEIIRTSPGLFIADGGPAGPTQKQTQNQIVTQLDKAIAEKLADHSWVKKPHRRLPITVHRLVQGRYR